MYIFGEGFPIIFDELCRRCADMICRYPALPDSNEDCAEDVVAETLLKAWLHKSDLPAESDKVMDWLLAMARDVLDEKYFRAAQQSALGQRLQDRLAGPDVADEISQLYEDRAMLFAMRSALKRLPPPEREAVLLVADGGWSYAKIAKNRGVPIGTIRSRISRGRKHLHKLTLQELTRAEWRQTSQPKVAS